VRSRGRFLFVVGVLLLAACTRQSAAPQTGTAARQVSDPLPVLSGSDLQGHAVSSQDFLGHVLVVNAWASWCLPYCAREQPELVATAEKYRDQGVRFLGINHMDQQAAADEWARHYDMPYPSLYDPSGKFAGVLGYYGLPDTYVVDPQGTIRYVIGPGPTTETQLSTAIDAVLAQTSASSATATNSPAR
jgi:cytochrome c biogenesis protein CcmG/thiol:disulfide interchange protein DsbE